MWLWFTSCHVHSQTISEELEVKSSHAKDVIACVKSIISSLHCGEATETRLQAHLASLSGALDPLEGRLSHRIAQLKFEKFQKVRSWLCLGWVGI